jgi:hypothetical protein
MSTKRLAISVLIAFGTLVVGCSAPTMLDQNWGRSFETARYSQTLNPDAGSSDQPVEGLDGHSAVSALENYRTTFTPQEASSGYDIKVSGLDITQ